MDAVEEHTSHPKYQHFAGHRRMEIQREETYEWVDQQAVDILTYDI